MSITAKKLFLRPEKKDTGTKFAQISSHVSSNCLLSKDNHVYFFPYHSAINVDSVVSNEITQSVIRMTIISQLGRITHTAPKLSPDRLLFEAKFWLLQLKCPMQQHVASGREWGPVLGSAKNLLRPLSLHSEPHLSLATPFKVQPLSVTLRWIQHRKRSPTRSSLGSETRGFRIGSPGCHPRVSSVFILWRHRLKALLRAWFCWFVLTSINWFDRPWTSSIHTHLSKRRFWFLTQVNPEISFL